MEKPRGLFLDFEFVGLAAEKMFKFGDALGIRTGQGIGFEDGRKAFEGDGPPVSEELGLDLQAPTNLGGGMSAGQDIEHAPSLDLGGERTTLSRHESVPSLVQHSLSAGPTSGAHLRGLRICRFEPTCGADENSPRVCVWFSNL